MLILSLSWSVISESQTVSRAQTEVFGVVANFKILLLLIGRSKAVSVKYIGPSDKTSQSWILLLKFGTTPVKYLQFSYIYSQSVVQVSNLNLYICLPMYYIFAFPNKLYCISYTTSLSLLYKGVSAIKEGKWFVWWLSIKCIHTTVLI